MLVGDVPEIVRASLPITSMAALAGHGATADELVPSGEGRDGGPRIPPVPEQALRPHGVVPLEVIQQWATERSPRRKGCCPAVVPICGAQVLVS